MREMIERVATALKQSIDNSPHNFGSDGVERVFEDAARAALEALREPTLEMVRTGARAVNADQMIIQIPQDVWLAMIDAALKD